MKKRNKIILLLTALAFTMTAGAQRLTTQTKVIDLGQVLYDNPVTAVFEMKNKSSRQVLIEKIETACGCTTVETDDMLIAGGKSFSLRTTYDARMLGHFYKQLWVYEQGVKQPMELVLKGVVVSELQDFSGSYPYTIGQILSDSREIEFDDVNRGQSPTQEIHIFNNTGETIQPVVMHLPAYLSAEVSPTRIAANKGGTVTFTLHSDKLRDMGLSQTSVFLGKYPGDKVAIDKEITTSVVLLPSFEGIVQEQYAPHAELSQTTMSLSSMTGKPTKLKGEITIHNTGQVALNIRSLQMFTSGLRVSLPKQSIEPGEQVKLKVQANREELKGKHRPRILMITNDPKNPKIVIEITE